MPLIYRHEFRYRSLFQIWSGLLTLALAIACGVAGQYYLVFFALAALLLFGSAAVWVGVARNDVAWFELRSDAIAWSSTGIGAGSNCVPFSRIKSVNLRNLSGSQALLIQTDEGSTVAFSDLYFGDGMEILNALAAARPELPLMLNDATYGDDERMQGRPQSRRS